MTKQLYEEALADVRKVKEIAEANAKRELEAIVTPRIRELIERELLNEVDEDELTGDDEDEEGRKVMTDVTPRSTTVEAEESDSSTSNLDALSMSSGDHVNDDASAKESSTKQTAHVSEIKNSVDLDKEISAITEEMNKRIPLLKNSVASRSIALMISRVENMYEYVQAKVSDQDKDRYETVLESLYQKLNKLQEQDMSKKNINETDLTLKLTNVALTDDADLEDIGVELITGEEDEEGDLGAGDDVGDAGEDVAAGEEGGDVDLGDLGLGDDEEEEEPALESKKLSDDTIVEIDERMLKRELARMSKIQEDNMPANILDDFGDGTDEGEPFLDGEVTTEDDDTDVKMELQNRRKRDEKGAAAADSHSTVGENKKQARRRAMLEAMRQRREARVAESKKTSPNQNSEALTEVKKVRAQLAEVSLINAKLLYTNKLLQLESLTARQKAQIIERLDEAKSLREAKLIYNGLVKVLVGASRDRVSEGKERGRVLGSSSRATAPSASSLNEGFETSRWAELAGITKK